MKAVAAKFKACASALALAALLGTSTANAADFNFDTGVAPLEVMVPNIVPVIYQSVSPDASDASLVLRITALVTNAWFDAIAPYHPTAVGVYSRLGRRPAEEGLTNANKNIAMMYATYRVLLSLLPQNEPNWRDMMTSVGLDPDDNSLDTTTPVGIGNSAGLAIVAARENDGMNQLGNEGNRDFNRMPYADYTGYEPVNTAYELRDPSRWQPNLNSRGNGIFQIQQFVTPQWALTTPYSYQTPNQFSVPAPEKSRLKGKNGRAGYVQQANEVLAISASLTDYQKAAAELFNDKLRSIGTSAMFVYDTANMTLDEFVHYDFMTNVAAFDGGIATWKEKAKYDAVRPFSAIRYLYKDQLVTAWGGPGKGTANIPASQWRSYINTADHPEYPSASSCFCQAHAQASRRFLGSDQFGWSVTVPAGSSLIEPGLTPAQDVVLGPWNTWTEFSQECGQSRVWGGVHFPDAVTAAQNMCGPIGDIAYEFVQAHVAGAVR